VRDSLEALLTVSGYLVETFPSAEAYLAHLEARPSDNACALLDVHMPGMSGLDLLRALGVRQISLPVLLLTASHDRHVLDQARELGAVHCMSKPVSESILLGAIESIRGSSIRRL
jgi:FixJ family two-component response regulator